MPHSVNVSVSKETDPGCYRPNKFYLDTISLLSDGISEEERNQAALNLSKLLSVEKQEKEQALKYCKDRLIRGLSSDRKFARVGFSVALTQILREFNDLTNEDVFETIKKHLNLKGEKRSKGETGDIYLGKAFAYSSLIQSGRITQMKGEDIQNMVEDLLTFAQKKSYLKAISINIIDNLVKTMSVDNFSDFVWSRIRDPLKEGWQNCTLEKLSLLFTCRETFPDILNKKFLKKHWGFPVLSEENDAHLLKVILGIEVPKPELIEMKILPHLLKLDRSLLSMWKGLGEPLMNTESVKNQETALQRRLIGLKFAQYLMSHSSVPDQILDLLLHPTLASAIFHSSTSRNDPQGVQGNTLFEVVQAKVKDKVLNGKDLAVRLWSLSAELGERKSGDLVTSKNFMRLVDQMDKEECVTFADSIIAAVNGTSEVIELSSNELTRSKQTESCLRCLHHIVCNQNVSSPELQKSTLRLFARLAFFNVTKKNSEIQFINKNVNFEEGKSNQTLCKGLFFKILDQLSTMAGSKINHMDGYISLLLDVAEYFQSLLKGKGISPIENWPEKFPEQWNKVCDIVKKIPKTDTSPKDKVFLFLFLHLTFQMTIDFKASSELLEEVHLCYEKSTKPDEPSSNSEEPAWQEVITEIVLNIMSLQSHLGRVMCSAVLTNLSQYLTIPAVKLITEVLIPKSGRDDDAGGVMVENEEEEEDLDDDDDSLIDEDLPDEESDEEDDDDESEEDSDEEQNEGMEIDDKFRASVQEALGDAAVNENGVSDEDEELSDLSDTEMFKRDDMLAEVFKQMKKAKEKKKNLEEKKKELITFRIRVLDLMEVLVKSDRCGDFVLELLQPLLLLMKNDSKENVTMINKSKSLLQQLKNKNLVDSLHSAEEQRGFVSEILELVQNVTDISKIQDISLACHIAMKLSYEGENEPGHQCNEMIQTSVQQMIAKGKSKPHPSFFKNLISYNNVRYQFLLPMLASCLKDATIKLHGKMICCSVISSLMRRTEKNPGDKTSIETNELVGTIAELISEIKADDIKAMFTKELFILALALQNRSDIYEQSPFGEPELQKLLEIKSQLSTDLRKMAMKLIAGIQRKLTTQTSEKVSKKKQKKKQKKKRRLSNEDEIQEPVLKKAKN